MSTGHESWEHYSRLVIDLLERHDKNLDKLEKQIINVRKETRHELEVAVSDLRQDIKALRDAFEGITEESIVLMNERLIALEKSSISLSGRVSNIESQSKDSKAFKLMIFAAIVAGLINIVINFIPQ